ncbi:uncharacterized protein LOC114277686 [Camellia sinensis]|uniref:uncharacterized protein LOC114277686 n=1 Tax=Camellia sinensis TaxID=4442 RepID=UPI00103654E1|nr:uncharacterized protein LOC114277686 [Camellia sinensis]
MRRLAFLRSGDKSWKFIKLKGEYMKRDYDVPKSSSVFVQATYLVESQEGNLLLVQRFWKSIDEDDFSNPIGKSQATWVQIKSIGNQALFLGGNHSVCVSSLEFPGCQSNCIYYTDQTHVYFARYVCHGPAGDDWGVFNLEDGSFRSLHIPNLYKKLVLPPIWVVPNLKGT